MDKRPLGIIGAVFFLTVLVLSRFGYEKSVFILPVFLMAVFFVFLKNKKIKFFAVITSSVLCASLIFGAVDLTFRTNEQYFSGKDIAVEGVICERPYFSDEKQYMLVKTDKINGEDVNIKIRVSALNLPENATLYNKVKFKANLYKVDSYEAGAMRSLKSKNICLTGTVQRNSLKVFVNESKPLMYHILSFRYRFYDTIENFLPNDIGGFIAGITMGEKSLMSGELTENFRITGTSHILVVSGLHVAIWSGFIYWLLRKFLSRKISSLFSIVFLVFFIIFTGFTASVIRAGVMMILNYAAIIFSEKPDPLNSLGISALVLTAADPFSIYNVGTVFSFASVLGILLMHEFVYKKIEEKLNRIKPVMLRKFAVSSVSLILVSLSAQIFTFPVSALYNMNFSFMSVVSNFFISSLCTFAMVTGGVGTLILSFFPEFILGKLSFGSSIVFSKLIILIIDKLSEYKEFYRNVTTIENYIFLFLVMILILSVTFLSMEKKKKLTVFVSLLMPIILISNLVPMICKNKFIEFSVIDVGYGMCVTLTHNEETVMLGSGNEYGATGKIQEHLEFIGAEKIKALYLPVNSSTSLVENAREIKENFDVQSVVTSAEYKFSHISPDTVSADYVDAEYFAGKVKIDYYTQENTSFALVRAGDKRILINFYGRLNEEILPSSCINPDIYVTMYEDTYITDFSATKEYVISTSYKTTYPASAEKVHTTMNNSTYTKLILV